MVVAAQVEVHAVAEHEGFERWVRQDLSFAALGDGVERNVAEDDLDRVFDRHYRGQNIAGKGAGLGLAIVKRLCELYGWSIHFSNRVEGGLCAELRFFGE